MGAGRVLAVLAVVTLVGAGCFPDPPKRVDGDVSDASSGLDTSTPGDTEPQRDTEGGEDTLVADTASDAVEDTAPDTAVADTLVADTVVADTVAPECTSPADCQHLAGTCVRVQCLGGSCAAQPDTGNPCDDGQACTKGDTCQGFSCVGTTYACDDGVACTDDVCTGDGGCSYPAKAGFCHIGAACVTSGKVKADDPCRVCVGGEAWSGNDGASCEDGDAVCTLEDTCVGTVCEPGGPPDDTAGDWAMNVVESTAPGQSAVKAVHQVGLNHWLMIAESVGSGVVPLSTSSLNLSNDSVVAVRRAPASVYAEAVWSGFDDAALQGSDAFGGWAMAIELQGSGHIVLPDGERDVNDLPPTTYLASFGVFGALQAYRPLEHSVRGLSVLHDGSIVTRGLAGPLFDNEELGIHHTGVIGESNAFVVKYSPYGIAAWAGRLELHDHLPLSVPICRVDGDGFAIATPFLGDVHLDFPSGLEQLTAPAGSSLAYGFVHTTVDGEVLHASSLFTFESSPNSSVDVPYIQCMDDGLVVVLRQQELTEEAPGRLIARAGRSTIAKFDWNGQLNWRLTSSALGIGLRTRGTRTLAYLGTVLGTQPNSIVLDITRADGTTMYSSMAPAALAELDPDGGLEWLAAYASSTLTVIMAMEPASGGIGLGGIFIGSAGSPQPNGTLPLSGGADFNAFAARINSQSGLTCESLLQ